jgi:hypothetical protein
VGVRLSLAHRRFDCRRRAEQLCQQPRHDAARRSGQPERMNKVKRRSPPAVLFQKPPNPLVDRVGNFLEPLLGDGKVIAQLDPCVVEKHAEHAAPVHDPIELDQFENLLARLAMKGQAQQRLPDLHHGSGRQIVKIVAIDHDVFTQIAKFEPKVGRHRTRRNQRLTKRRARYATGDAARAACDPSPHVVRCLHGPCVRRLSQARQLSALRLGFFIDLD